MKELCGKSRLLTGYLELLLEQHLTAGNTTEPGKKEGTFIEYMGYKSFCVCGLLELQWIE